MYTCSIQNYDYFKLNGIYMSFSRVLEHLLDMDVQLLEDDIDELEIYEENKDEDMW
jgi:hypothetical protein